MFHNLLGFIVSKGPMSRANQKNEAFFRLDIDLVCHAAMNLTNGIDYQILLIYIYSLEMIMIDS